MRYFNDYYKTPSLVSAVFVVNVFRYFSFVIFGKFSIDPVLVVANW